MQHPLFKGTMWAWIFFFIEIFFFTEGRQKTLWAGGWRSEQHLLYPWSTISAAAHGSIEPVIRRAPIQTGCTEHIDQSMSKPSTEPVLGLPAPRAVCAHGTALAAAFLPWAGIKTSQAAKPLLTNDVICLSFSQDPGCCNYGDVREGMEVIKISLHMRFPGAEEVANRKFKFLRFCSKSNFWEESL